MRSLPEPPPWIASLPHDSRGFPVPAEAGWVSGLPVLSKVAVDRKVALGMRRGCAICGYQMPRGRAVYRAFAQGDAAQMRLYETELSNDWAGPTHYSCILYSAIVCPYLREKGSRLGKANEINPGGFRGGRAAIMGFRDFGLMIWAAPHPFLNPAPRFALIELVDDIPYRDGTELQGRYEKSIAGDAQFIDTSMPRLFWTDDPEDQSTLQSALKADFATIRTSQPIDEHIIAGEGRYFIYST